MSRYVADASDLATQNPPNDATDYNGGTNSVLRFGVAALLFTSLYVGMWLYVMPLFGAYEMTVCCGSIKHGVMFVCLRY